MNENQISLVRGTVIKVLGVGGAGGNLAVHLAAAGFAAADFVAINTDATALGACTLAAKHQLGAALTRGLGAGGDPEVGRTAAEADVEMVRGFCADAEVVLILAGLGGGTGTGAAPVLAQLAKESGALVLAAVTLPFECEGKRRMRQAQLGLERLRRVADAVITLPNQHVLQVVDEDTRLAKTFDTANDLLVQGLLGLARLFQPGGLIPASFADLCAVVRGRHTESCMATAEIVPPAGADELVERLLAHPCLQGGKALDDAEALLVSLAGGPELTMAEVNRVMDRLNARCEEAEVVLGAAVDAALTGRLVLTVVVARRKVAAAEQLPVTRAGIAPQPAEESDFHFSTPATRSATRLVPPAPMLTVHQTEQLLGGQAGTRARRKSARARQQQLPLEIVSKGRFEKSEPTIHHGEDLDVPTFMRRNVPLN
ncbi:MAG: hypothetical protein EXS19_00400 [Pedosphaera sp.]|nr:hypothetical protein [Pedosphaera sp.]